MTPRVAILLDENTSGDASRYEAHKGYFHAVVDRGAHAFGVPFEPAMVDSVVESFDGLLVTGGRFAYPASWYGEGLRSQAPESDRLQVEIALLTAFLARDKPLLAICAGMQALAGLHGCALHPDLRMRASPVDHDRSDARHDVALVGALAEIVGAATLSVNSFHREGVIEPSAAVTVTGRAADGLIEAIAIPGKRFAHGVQWHPERSARLLDPGLAVFDAFVAACR